MALLFTSKAVENAVIRKRRKLSAPGEVLVSIGDVVNPETIVAKAEFVKGNPHVVDLRSELKRKTDPELVDRVLIKKQGDAVKLGEVIARYEKGFWSEIIEVKSPCDGVIEYISRTQGRVIIREDPKTSKPLSMVAAASRLRVRPRFIRMFTVVREGDHVVEGGIIATTGDMDFVYAPISGIVEKICTLSGTITIVKPIKHTKVVAHIKGEVIELISNYGAVIETVGAYIQGVFGMGGECSGELLIMCEKPDEIVGADEIDVDVEGMILVCGSFISYEALQKAREKGAVGVITGGMDQLDLVRMAGKELSIGTTGQEDIDFTVVILEGFGQIPINRHAWDILKNNDGAIASIDGTTQIRAGVLRPEVIINKYNEAETDLSSVDSQLPLISEEKEIPIAIHAMLRVGDTVRCIRPPYFGEWGIVKELPDDLKQIECETMVEVAVVKLDDGSCVTIPQANLEAF